MFPLGSIQSQAMSGNANAAATTRLPQEALENILVRLPASDLRRFRRICKEWHDIISDPIFIKAHMVEGPLAPTHTIVFVPSSMQPTSCNGFLFDERWGLMTRFTVGVSEVMIGTCNGLLCFHDSLHDVVKIVEPFTGETIALPVPTDSQWRHDARSYCFGFDATARQYKIVHKGRSYNPGQGSGTLEYHLKVLTVGADKEWRTVSIPHTYRYNSDLACNGGAVYWIYHEYADKIPIYELFDLATEEIMSVKCHLAEGQPIICHHPWWQRGEPVIMRIRWLAGESDDSYWPRNMNAKAFDAYGINLFHKCRLMRRHAVQRGHLLLREANGDLYAHKIMSRNIHELELGCEKWLIRSGMEEETTGSSSSSGQFIRVHNSRQTRTQRMSIDSSEDISTFAYVPTVSPAPLALYFGTPMIAAPANLCVPPVEKLHHLKHD